ncbi:MAG: DUF2723 domain-containing protein [Acidobacteria bacterium]|nr:DUF2723 domain-containing protein [Acidobacteriota bacterium]
MERGDESHRKAPGSTSGGVWQTKPYLVVLAVAAVYLVFPSSRFNADGLHYNLLGFMSVHDPGVLLRDEAVPAHLLWHLLTSAILAVVRPGTPEASLYVLRLVNILLALGAIAIFARLVRSIAGASAAMWATLVLAFSQACLENFLSVEVYALNTLVLVALYAAARRVLVKAPAEQGGRDLLAISLLCALAVLTHLANIVLVPAVGVAFLMRDRRRGVWHGLLFGVGVGGVLVAAISGIAMARSIDLPAAFAYFFNYSGKTGTYLTPDRLGNLSAATRSLGAAVLGRFGVWGAIPAAIFLVHAVRHRRRLVGDLFIGLLLACVAIAGAFLSQWDPENTEHKIALILPLLLLVASIHARIGAPLGKWARAGAAAFAIIVVVAGFVDGILPFTRLEEDPLFTLSSQIHDRTTSPDVLVVGLASASTGHAVTLESMTFFGQRVAVLSREDAEFDGRLRDYQTRGFAIVSYASGRVGELEVRRP